MKRLHLFAMVFLTAGILVSCKKYQAGCMDPTADNYSKYAKIDDGSCFKVPAQQQGLTKSVEFYTTSFANWFYDAPSYKAVFSWPVINAAVANNGDVQCSVMYNSSWVELPFTFYVSDGFSSTLTFGLLSDGFVLTRTDSDLTNPGNPGVLNLKLTAIY